jgi:hypothetical protein
MMQWAGFEIVGIELELAYLGGRSKIGAEWQVHNTPGAGLVEVGRPMSMMQFSD